MKNLLVKIKSQKTKPLGKRVRSGRQGSYSFLGIAFDNSLHFSYLVLSYVLCFSMFCFLRNTNKLEVVLWLSKGKLIRSCKKLIKNLLSDQMQLNTLLVIF